MIYPLPENPTPADIIERSLTAHPSLFLEALERQAQEHAISANKTANIGAKRGAQASYEACDKVKGACLQDLSPREQAKRITLMGVGPTVIALNLAGKLQCLPRHVITASIVNNSHD